jgi:hypothetical protein
MDNANALPPEHDAGQSNQMIIYQQHSGAVLK